MRTFLKTGLAAAAILCVPGMAQAAELVTNGDFSAGDSGFTSTYDAGGGNTPPGNYYIQTGGDHTTGTGNWFYADANSNSDYFWSQTFDIVANTTYNFSLYALNVNGGSQPSLSAYVNGVLLGSIAPATGGWMQLTGSFNLATTTATLRLFNDNHAYIYNDLGVDDISVTGAGPGVAGGVPEPASWALMLAGFGIAGAAVRRRRGGARIVAA